MKGPRSNAQREIGHWRTSNLGEKKPHYTAVPVLEREDKAFLDRA